MTHDESDKRDLRIHNTIERAVHTIGSMHGISREEVIDRMEAFVEAEREEQETARRLQQEHAEA